MRTGCYKVAPGIHRGKELGMVVPLLWVPTVYYPWKAQGQKTNLTLGQGFLHKRKENTGTNRERVKGWFWGRMTTYQPVGEQHARD